MTDRSADFTAYMAESPRVLILNKAGAGDMTVIVQQDLAESIRYIEKVQAQMDDQPLLATSGKQSLGGGSLVGITNTLKNTQFGFEARTGSVAEGTITNADTLGRVLEDSTKTFITSGVVKKGALVVNITDKSVGTVLKILTETKLLLALQLDDGTDNDFDLGDVYKIWNIEQCKITEGNMVAVDDVEAEMIAIFPTPFIQIIQDLSTSPSISETGVSGLTSPESVKLFSLGSPAEILAEPVDGAVTLGQAIFAALAALTGKATGGGTTQITFRNYGDTADAVVMTVDEDGNRSQVVITFP